jgi:hypothetical protein
MTTADWSQPTSQGEAFARARGRRCLTATQRHRAEVRRLQVRRRLPGLQKDVWATCPEGMVPRVTVGGILHKALTALADELGVHPTTIRKDLQTIAREDLRRWEIAQRLPALREEAGVSRKGRLPKDVVWRLACEFSVTPWTIRQDIATIDASSTYTRPPSPKTQPWDQWARLRPRPTILPRRVSTRLPEHVYQQLLAHGEVSLIVRRAIEAYLDTGTHHHTEDCAMTVVRKCAPDAQDRLVRTAERLKLPLWEVLASLLLLRSKEA